MNYLGHIYFSNNNLRLAKANLFGDSVKGTHLEKYPDFVQQGIRLHREIDNYIDHHPKVMELIRIIRPDLPKIASVAVDLYFDHLLAKNWKDWHTTPLQEFLDDVHSNLQKLDREVYTDDFNFFIGRLCELKWMNAYSSEYGLDKMCNGVSRRISFDNELKNGLAVFHKYETKIVTAFNEYMTDANEHFKSIHLGIKL